MARRLPTLLLCVCVCATTAPFATERAVSVRATATIEPRTSVAVSRDILEFVVAEGSEPAARVDFTVGVRAVPDAEVLLIAEPDLPQAGGPGAPLSLEYTGEGEGATAGIALDGVPAVVARWSGGGQRRGHVLFALRGAPAGIHRVPVRFRVSVP